MRGLLIKDFKLILSQYRNFMILFIMALFFAFTMEDGLSFAVGYSAIFGIIFATGTISYDELDKGFLFLFTLPVSRKMYAIEKYLFGMIISGGLLATLFIINLIKTGSAAEYSTFLVMLMVALLGLSFMIPLHIQFGGEKVRIVVLALAVVTGGSIFAMKRLISAEQVATMVSKIDVVPVPAIITVMAVGSIVAVAVSMFASVVIIEKKEY